MRIRITKKTDEKGVVTYYAYRRDKVFFLFPYWVYTALVVDLYPDEDPISKLKKRVEFHVQKEVIVLEYDL